MSFPTKYPSIELELVDGTSSRLEEALVRGVIDAAFLVPSVLCRRRAIFVQRICETGEHAKIGQINVRGDTGRPVSIHAPVKGATRTGRLSDRADRSFNPRAREGRDPPLFIPSLSAKGFNPRAREGRDMDARGIESSYNCFNPRAREGRDAESRLHCCLRRVSIHAPVKGATI